VQPTPGLPTPIPLLPDPPTTPPDVGPIPEAPEKRQQKLSPDADAVNADWTADEDVKAA